MPHPIVLAISGASGAIYAVRLLEVLVNMGHDVHLTISPSGAVVLKQELDIAVDLEHFQLGQLMLDAQRSTGDSKIDILRQQAGISSGDSNVLEIRSREPGKRNDLADLQSQIDLLHRMRERFTLLSVKRAWENEGQRQEIIQAIGELQEQLRRIAGGGEGGTA